MATFIYSADVSDCLYNVAAEATFCLPISTINIIPRFITETYSIYAFIKPSWAETYFDYEIPKQ